MRMDENFLRYSGLDSACTFECHDAFWGDIDPLFTPANDMTMSILPVLMFMQTRGVQVSRAALNETKIEVLASQAEKQKELNELCGRVLNVNSPKDCQKYFYGELGIPPITGKKGTPTVDDMALQRLVRGTVARPILRQAKLVQEIRGLGKLYGTYSTLLSMQMTDFDARTIHGALSLDVYLRPKQSLVQELTSKISRRNSKSSWLRTKAMSLWKWINVKQSGW